MNTQPNSAHNQVGKGYEDLIKQHQHLQSVIEKHSIQEKLDNRTRLYAFDRKKLTYLAKLYSSDFSEVDLMALVILLQNFIVDMRSDENFPELKGIGEKSLRPIVIC